MPWWLEQTQHQQPLFWFSLPKKIPFSAAEELTHWGQDKMAAIFQAAFSNASSWIKNVWISIKISLQFVPKGPINNIPGLVQIMAWRRTGDKPLSEAMLTYCQLDSWEQILVKFKSDFLSFSFPKMHFKLSSAKMAAILSRRRWVNKPGIQAHMQHRHINPNFRCIIDKSQTFYENQRRQNEITKHHFKHQQ